LRTVACEAGLNLSPAWCSRLLHVTATAAPDHFRLLARPANVGHPSHDTRHRSPPNQVPTQHRPQIVPNGRREASREGKEEITASG
jgi:hypothetical protein